MAKREFSHPNEMHKYVGQEPSGRMFNELSLDFNSKSWYTYIQTETMSNQ